MKTTIDTPGGCAPPDEPAADDAAVAVCPRCGRAFACGARQPGPCACAGVVLAAPLQADLRRRYQGCLCLACLQALAAGAPIV